MLNGLTGGRVRRWSMGVILTVGSIASIAAQANTTIKIGAAPGINADALYALESEAKAKGIDVKVVEFTDWTLPNEALNNKDIDLNFFQHQPFLANAIKERGYKLSFIGFGLLQNIGIYSNRVQSIAAVPDKAKVSIPNDPVNRGRGLNLLQKAGLIKLRTGNAPGATLDDITSNPKHLQFFEIEGPQLIRSLDDVNLAVVWPSYFVKAGQADKAGKALLYSGIDDKFYAMGFVARTDRAKDPELLKFVGIFQKSSAVRRVIDNAFGHNANLYTLPW